MNLFSQNIRNKTFEGGYDPEMMEMPQLLSDNINHTALCANNWVTVGAEYHSAITYTCT
jgi:hypothetical protein